MTSTVPSKLDFQALFEAAPALCLAVLPDTPRYTIIAASDAYLRATGTTRDDILGRALVDVIPEVTSSLARVLSNRAPDQMPARQLGEHWWRPRNYPVVGPGGEVTYIIHALEDVTEQLDFEAERSLALAASFFEHAAYCIFIADLDGRFTDVNAAGCKMLGYARGELIGKNIADVVHSEDAPRLTETRECLLPRGTIRVAEWTYLKKDGVPVPVEVSDTILPDGRWQMFVRDIRERRRVMAELRDANAFLDAIIENIPLMLFLKESTSLRFVRFNRAGESLLGWPRQSLIGKSDFDFWPREQAEFFVEKDRETMKLGKVTEIVEEPIQTRHQGIRILHTRKVPIFDRTGTPQYLLGISEDITEQKRLADERRFLADVSVALAASLDYEQTLATVTQLAVQRVADWCAIDMLEKDGQLRRLKVASADPADAALCAVLEQMPPDRALPYFMRFIFDGRQPVIIEQVTPQFIESIAQGPEHAQSLRATGVTSAMGVPLVLRGQAFGVLLFGSSNHRRVYDRGDLRWAEAVADRSAVAIENARLYRASLQASQLRDQVLRVVAHDLRNPLSTIALQTDVLRERGGSERELGVIHRAATRMNRLIQDLLDVSLMELGKLSLQKECLSATDLVVDSVESQKALAAASVDLRIDVASDIPDVWGDRDRLLQVFENLIGNALKFSTPGARITVGATSRAREVVFWVADTGCGIAADALPHVFEQFWQATRGDHRGAGLGLTIVKGIVEAHQGHVWVESTLGRGTTFYFVIPRQDLAPDRSSRFGLRSE